MTTIGIAPAPVATRLRLTVRGRRVLAAIIVAPLAAAIGMAALGGGAALASHESGAARGSFSTVTVVAGDSLWSIAQRVAPNADPRDVVDALVRLNALESVSLIPGDHLAVPAQYAPAK